MKLKIYRYSGGFVRDAGKRIQAVQVIRTTSLLAAAMKFGTSVYDLREHGGETDGGPWLVDIATSLTQHPNVVHWHPLDERHPVTWRTVG